MKKEMGSFVIGDQSKCTGCKACELACFAAHNKGNHVGNTIGTVEIPVVARLYVTKTEDACMPIQCRHCDNSPCLNACCTPGAIRREGQKIIINDEKCIGCKNCMMACPFGAIEMAPLYRDGKKVFQAGAEEVKTASKCDLCIDRGTPACVEACPNHALKLVTPEADLKEKRIQAALALSLTKEA